jgi:hypothetical protein
MPERLQFGTREIREKVEAGHKQVKAHKEEMKARQEETKAGMVPG